MTDAADMVPPAESSTMPAESTPKPWVMRGEAGMPARYPVSNVLNNQWGFGLGKEVPLDAKGYLITASGNAVVNTMYGGPGGPVRLSYDRVAGSPSVAPMSLNSVKWGYVVFDFHDADFYRCTTESIAREHGIYATILGGPISWRECLWDRCYGQAVQIVYAHPDNPARKSQTALSRETWLRTTNSLRDQWLVVERCETKEVGITSLSERASYALSFFEPLGQNGPWLNPVRVQGCWLETSHPWTDPNGQYRDCAGAIMAHCHPKVILADNRIVFRHGDRDVIQLWSCPDVEIRGNAIEATQAVDIRVKDHTDRIVIEANRGTAPVVISSNPWYVWGNNGWDESKVIHRGWINENYRMNC